MVGAECCMSQALDAPLQDTRKHDLQGNVGGKDTCKACILSLNLLASNKLKHEWKIFFFFPGDGVGSQMVEFNHL